MYKNIQKILSFLTKTKLNFEKHLLTLDRKVNSKYIQQRIYHEAKVNVQLPDECTSDATIRQALENVFKLQTFRPQQLRTITAVLSKKDVLMIAPSGGGKSLCYQLPAIINYGFTLVISPLVALMQNQVWKLKGIGINAEYLASTNLEYENRFVLEKMIRNDTSPLKLLYVTPERLAQSKNFMNALRRCFIENKLQLIAIDEVHCISELGHTFRPDYDKLKMLKILFPDIPILGVTATATNDVICDVQRTLNIYECMVVKAPMTRPNFYYHAMTTTEHEFFKLGNIYTRSTFGRSKYMAFRRFKSFFGVTPQLRSIIWAELENYLPSGSHPKHLLWCLSFLKQYSTEHYRRSIFKADEQTLRKWTWTFVQLLSNLNVIIWEKRFDDRADEQTCFTSLDGVDFPILEPTPFDPGWYSHKFKSAGLRYEIALNIRTGYIIWANGGYPCGRFSDLRLARESYVLSVDLGERTIADRGYNDAIFFIQRNGSNRDLHKRILSRHETVNKRLKQFQILKQQFRHQLEKHPMVFHAVANVTQMKLQNGELNN